VLFHLPVHVPVTVSRNLGKDQTWPFVNILKLRYHRMLMVSKSTEINWSDKMSHNTRALSCEFRWELV